MAAPQGGALDKDDMGGFINLKTKLFGRLQVLERTGKNNNGSAFWKCLCNCGKIKFVSSSLLIGGKTKSCGCLRKELSKIACEKIVARRSISLAGKRFGRLLVTSENKIVKNRHKAWLCICDCGKQKYIQARFLIGGDTSSCGCYGKEQALKGRRATSRGLTPLLHLLRGQKIYHDWRIAVFERDNFTCQECGVKSGNGKAVVLNADHIKPVALILLENNITTLEEIMNCMDLWLVENGRTLCIDCHKNTDTFGGKMHGILHNYNLINL